ncbi:MAG: hypothetical protein ACE5KZ_04520 [Candidatus Scalinduaceae bacterium]
MSSLSRIKILPVVSFFLIINIFFTGLSVFKCKIVGAQHIDVFNLDKSKLPKKVQPDAPEMEWIVVEDRIRYEVVVEKSKYDSNDIRMDDIELWEIVDKSPFEWHQVEYYVESDIKEIHIRTFGNHKCERTRDGTMFWLKDGKKAVYWAVWSDWDCRPEGKKD